MKRLIPIYALLTAFALLASVSCNSSDDAKDGEPISISANTLVSNFRLQKDDSIMALLDSVKFTVDVNRQVIYNADSLPKGTKITRLLADITFAASTSTGEIAISNATTMQDTTFAYTASSSDSIDFTGKVYLTVNAADGISTKRYELKVNVHQVESDSLYWDQLARRNLPANSMEVDDQKTVQQGSKIYCLAQSHGNFTLSVTEDPGAKSAWTVQSVDFGFTPDVSSLCATDDAFYILSTDKGLYRSEDGLSWTATGRPFHSLIAGYGSKLLTVSSENGVYYTETYTPAGTEAKTAIEKDFPVSGFSQPCAFTSGWGSALQIFIIGGVRQDGKPTGDFWGYDGNGWAKLSEKPVPARTGMTLVPYYNYMKNMSDYAKFPVLLAMGGKADVPAHNKVYISYDNGIHWKLGDELLQLPEYIPDFYGAQAFVVNTTMTAARAAKGWQPVESRSLPFWLVKETGAASRAGQPVTSWDCPYIYIFGGYSSDGTLQNNIWKGVLNRLTFKPII